MKHKTFLEDQGLLEDQNIVGIVIKQFYKLLLTH